MKLREISELDCSDVRLIAVTPHYIYCYNKKVHRHFRNNGAVWFDENCDCDI